MNSPRGLSILTESDIEKVQLHFVFLDTNTFIAHIPTLQNILSYTCQQDNIYIRHISQMN